MTLTTCNNSHDPYINYKAAEILKGLSSQFYPHLHYWATVFFTLRIQILSLSDRFILNRERLSNLPMKEETLGSKLGIDDLRDTFLGVQPTATKTAKKAENHSTVGPIATVGKSWL